MSLPAGERGLKSDNYDAYRAYEAVAPRRGAWIEIISISRTLTLALLSLPAGERGLKS